MQNYYECPIWGDGYGASIQAARTHPGTGLPVIDVDALIVSTRAGGPYRLALAADHLIRIQKALSADAKARLTTWLVDQRRHGIIEPVITWEIANSFRLSDEQNPMSVSIRGERLLRFLVDQTKSAGDEVDVNDEDGQAYAWSESTQWSEISYLLKYLSSRGLIEIIDRSSVATKRHGAVVTVNGYGFIEEANTAPDSTQAFVAMWFSEEMDDAYSKGIKPAIDEAGYKSLRIDLKMDVKKIDDEIFAEIRRSRFLVADMTQGDDGARGGVYFEAGLAEGLGLPVLYSCRKDRMKHLAFDTRQFFHIEWDTPDELRKDLATRIRARVGQGPLRGVSNRD